MLSGVNLTKIDSLLCGKKVIYWVGYISTLRSVVIGGASSIRKETIILSLRQDFKKRQFQETCKVSRKPHLKKLTAQLNRKNELHTVTT